MTQMSCRRHRSVRHVFYRDGIRSHLGSQGNASRTPTERTVAMKSVGKALALCLLATIAGTTFAQDAGVAASQEAGRITGPAFHSSQSRVQVDAQLAAATRNGDLSVGGETALREKDISPGVYPADSMVAGRSRAAVEAETMAAVRNGDISTGGQLAAPENTVDPTYYAGREASDATRLAQSQAPMAMMTSAH
jgi:hypothetical protein